MAAEIVLALVGPAIDHLAKLVAKPIMRQFNYLCCFTSNINSLKDEAKNLDDALAGLEREVERSRCNLQEPVPLVKTWLTNSNNLKVKINGILNEAENVGTGCSKLGARFSLSKRAKKTTDRTKELLGKKPKAEFESGPIAARQAVQLGNIFEFESRKKIEEAIMTTLTEGSVNMIGIYGMGGLGKTTMAKKLMYKALKENVIDEVVMAVVSESVDESKIQDEIGGQLGLKLTGETSQGKVQKLHARLSGTEKILVILDDVWEGLELENLGIPCGPEGCTILITSRNKNALSAMGFNVENRIFEMKILSEEEAWDLFRGGAGKCVDDTKLNSIAKEVAQECRGLPIALKALGLALKDKKADTWNDALRELKQCDAEDIPNYRKEVYTPLMLSYKFLDSEKAKSLFLLCCLFPEDYNIPLEQLTYFCMGLGIFKGITNMDAARKKMCALTEILKDRSLLLDSDKEDCVRMHDVFRDICIIIAKQEGRIGGNDCTWISSFELDARRSDQFSIRSEFPKLRLLLLNRTTYGSLEEEFKFDDAFLEGMRELHVLCIERYSLTTLPLGKLNTLILDSCYKLETISVVGELVSLEILICRDCSSIEKLPSEMKGLSRLKLLELTGCEKLQSIGRGIISSLVGLEELKMHQSFNRWEAEGREERENAGARLRELEDLTNLACLEIDIEDPSLVTENMPLLLKKLDRFIIRTDGPYYYQSIPSKFSKAMILCLDRETRLGDWIGNESFVLRDTEYLKLRGDGANNVDLAKCQNIRWLELFKCESMKNVVRTSGGADATVFPSIEHLELNSLPELQEICDGPISSTSFQNLMKLEFTGLEALTQIWKSGSVCENNYVPHFTNLSSINIWYCPSLRNLGQLSMAGKDCLPQLQQLSIWRCSMMEQVFLWNGENITSIQSQRKRHVITKVFPKLKEVKLDDLPNLTVFYQGIQGIEFPTLREMVITKCPKMKSIIGSSSADIDEDDSLHLLICQPQKISFGSSLEILEINHNHEIPSSLFSLGLVAAPNLEVFSTDLTTYAGVGVDVAFDSLKVLYIKENKNPLYDDHKISVSLFNGLEDLRFTRYKGGSMSLFSSSAVGNLVNLKVLHIIDCDLVNVIEDEEEKADGKVVSGEIMAVVFPKLEELHLICLPNLVCFCEWKYDVELPSLTKLEIEQCPNLEMGFVAAPNLKIEIDREGFGAIKDLNRALHQHCLAREKIEQCHNMEDFSMGSVVAPNLKIVQIDREEIGATKDLDGALQQYYLARWEMISFNLKFDYPFYGHKIPSSLFKRLEELTIEKYVGSMSLFTLSMAANLVSLRKLLIENCDEMIKVIEDEQQERIILFPKLEILKLKKLPKLVSFCDWNCEVELPLLWKVEIERCPNMENLRLGLVATPNLEAFATDLTTYVGVGVDVAFDSLKILWITDNENPLYDDRKISISLFNGLEKLEFTRYKGATSLFSSSAVGNLVNLKVLSVIVNCDLVNVMEDDEEKEDGKVVSDGQIRTLVFPKLEELQLHWLPKLVRFCEWKCDVELPSLTEVKVLGCPNMENFSMGFVVAPNLKIVEIDFKEIGGTEDLNEALQQHYLARQEKEINEEEKSSEEMDEIEEVQN